MNRLEKSMPPMIRPMIGMNTSSTSDETMAPKAAPMITPMARSIMLPLMAKSRNSFSMRALTPLFLTRRCPNGGDRIGGQLTIH
jgi:hypothetical protein